MKNDEEVLYVFNECQEIHVDETDCCEICEYGWENEALREVINSRHSRVTEDTKKRVRELLSS